MAAGKPIRKSLCCQSYHLIPIQSSNMQRQSFKRPWHLRLEATISVTRYIGAIWIGVLVLTVLPAGLSHAQKQPLIVAVEVLAPCVIKSNGAYTGFEIELWEEISKELGIEFTYHETDMAGIFSGLTNGDAHIGFSCITINHEREKRMDFSHHTLDSGLRILVRDEKIFSFFETVKSLFSPLVIKALAYLGLFIVVCGHVFWWVERGKHLISVKYFPGILHSFWYVLVTMTTVGYGDIVPRRWVGRVMAFLVMLIGIAFFGWAVAQFSSAITIQKLHSDIKGKQDLRGKLVATVAGTTSVDALVDLGAKVVPVKIIDTAFEMLLKRKVDAVVFDSPTILHYARHVEDGDVAVIGDLFELQYYGFVFPQGSELRESVNRILLKIRKSGQYDRIFNKWFGSY